MSSDKSPILLDNVRRIMQLKHYSIYTKRTYCDWIRQFVKFHRMSSREELFVDSEAKIEAFLSYLAKERLVAASTQKQAMNNGVCFQARVGATVRQTYRCPT